MSRFLLLRTSPKLSQVPMVYVLWRVQWALKPVHNKQQLTIHSSLTAGNLCYILCICEFA